MAGSADDGIGNSFDIGGSELVVLPDFHKAFGGIDDQDIGVVALLFQNQNDGRNARAEEDISRQSDDGVDVVALDEFLADAAFLAASEQYAVRQNDGHYAIGLNVVEVVQQKGVIGFCFGGQPKTGIARVGFFVLRLPLLRVRGIGNHGIDIERLVAAYGVVFVEPGPVRFQGVGIARYDVIGQYASHDQIHTGQVVGVFLDFLGVVFDVVFIVDVPGHAVANVDQQGAEIGRAH